MNWSNPSERALEALLNGGYQGMILIGCTAILLKMLPKTNAATRHAVLYISLVLAAALPLLHIAFPHSGAISIFELRSAPVFEHTSLTEAPFQKEFKGQERAQADEVLAPIEHLAHRDLKGSELMQAQKSDSGAGIEEGNSLAMETQTRDVLSPVSSMKNAPALPFVAEMNDSMPGENTRQHDPIFSWKKSATSHVISSVHWWDSWMMAPLYRFILWGSIASSLILMISFIATVKVARLVFQLIHLRKLKREATPVGAGANRLFETIKQELGLAREATLLKHPNISSPMAVGFRSAAVILPDQIENSATQPEMEQLLRHEMAHLSRRDDWSNLVQLFLKACFWFHPGIVWLCHRLTIEREIACDDQVLSTIEERENYALLLTEFASRKTSREWAAAQAAWSNTSQLKERIHMILNSQRNSNPVVARVRALTTGSMAALLAILALNSAPRLAFAEKQQPAEANDPSNKSTTSLEEVSIQEQPAAEPVEIPVEKVEKDILIHVAPQEGHEEPVIIEKRDGSGRDVLILKGPKGIQRVEREIVVGPNAEPALAPAAALPRVPSPTVRPVMPIKPRAYASAGAFSPEVEDRLARLERMMEKLLEREGLAKREEDIAAMHPHQEGAFLHKRMAPLTEDKLRAEVERNVRSIERNVREMEKSRAMAEESLRRAKRERKEGGEMKAGGLEAEREALREHQKALEQQLKAIQERLETLEKSDKSKSQPGQSGSAGEGKVPSAPAQKY